jgi:hypothetical protein
MASQQDVLEVLTMLAAVYPRFTLTKESVGAYAILLEDLDPNDLRAAAKDVATKSKWFPSVHELRAAVVRLAANAAGVPTTFEAWAEVISTGPPIRRWVEDNEDGQGVIKSEPYQWSHPIVEHVAIQLGWPKFPANEDSLMADRAHFLKAYDRAVINAMEDEITLPEVREFIEAKRQGLLESGEEQDD